MRPEIRDLIKKLPKKRGYRFTVFQEKPAVLNLEVVNKFFNDNDQVNPQAMADKGLIRNIGGNRRYVNGWNWSGLAKLVKHF